jgi:hypothetical protein
MSADTPIDFPRVRASLLLWPQSNDYGHVSYRKFSSVCGWRAYVRLAGDPEPKALHFRWTMIADCGTGLYVSRQAATMFIRRTLKKMGIVSA